MSTPDKSPKTHRPEPKQEQPNQSLLRKPGEGFLGGNSLHRKPGERFFDPKPLVPPAIRNFYRSIQQKPLEVNQPGDAHEKEADAVADNIMRMPAPAPAEKKKEEDLQAKEEETVQAKEKIHEAPIPITPRRKEEEEETLQAKGEGVPEVTPDFEQGLYSSKGGGNPLPDGVKQQMESGIGADFSNVRIHTGSNAAALSNSIQAHAFTHGSDIYFNEGKYSPGTDSGKHLLAHELTHTVQQGAAGVQTKLQRDPDPYTTIGDGVLLDLDLDGNLSSRELNVSVKKQGNSLVLTFRHIEGTKVQSVTVIPDNMTLGPNTKIGASATDGIHPLTLTVWGDAKQQQGQNPKGALYYIGISPTLAAGIYKIKATNKEGMAALAAGGTKIDLGVPVHYADGASKKIIMERAAVQKEGGLFRVFYNVGPKMEVAATLNIIKNTDDAGTVICAFEAAPPKNGSGIQTSPNARRLLKIPVPFEKLDIQKITETNNSILYSFVAGNPNQGFMITYEMAPENGSQPDVENAAHGFNVYPVNALEGAVPETNAVFTQIDGAWRYGHSEREMEGFGTESAKDAFDKFSEMKIADNESVALMNDMSLLVMMAVKEQISSEEIYKKWMEFSYSVTVHGPMARQGDITATEWLEKKGNEFISALSKEINNKGYSVDPVDALTGVMIGAGVKEENKYTGATRKLEVDPTRLMVTGPPPPKQLTVDFARAKELINSRQYEPALSELRDSYYLWIEDQLLGNKNPDIGKRKDLQAYGYQLSYRRQLRERFAKESKPLTKVKVVFYPDLGNLKDEKGNKKYVGDKMVGIPLDVFYKDNGDEWVIYNFTSLTKAGTLNTFERSHAKTQGEIVPPTVAFDKFTDDKQIGTGFLHYQFANVEKGGIVKVENPWTTGDYILAVGAAVGMIALALTGIGLLADGAIAASIGGAAIVVGDIAAITTVVGASVKLGEDISNGVPITPGRIGEFAIDITTSVLPFIRTLRGASSLAKFKGLFILADKAANAKWLAKADALANMAAITVASEQTVVELTELSKALEEGRIDEATFYWAVLRNVGMGAIHVVMLRADMETMRGRSIGGTTIEAITQRGVERELLTGRPGSMYTPESLEAGISIMQDGASVYRNMVMEALTSEKDFEKAIDVLCYLGAKGRGGLEDVMIVNGRVRRTVDVLVEGKFYGKTLAIPQGFRGSKGEKLDDVQRDFDEFSAAVLDGVHGVPGLEGAEVHMQGSATMGIAKPKVPKEEGGKIWDYDLAIMMDRSAYNKKLAAIFNNKAKYKNGTKPDLESMSDTELMALAQRMNADKTKPVGEREFNSEAHTFGNGIVTGKANMSKDYFKDLAKLKDKIGADFGIKFLDFSVIAKGSSFDSTPTIKLKK